MENQRSIPVLKAVRIALFLGILVAGVRLVWIFWERRADEMRQAEAEQKKVAASRLEADHYVVPRKLRAYDLKSARELTEQPAWVRDGYRYPYFPYDSTRQKADFHKSAGMLGPIERLEIKDVVTGVSPDSPQRQVLAVFQKNGQLYAYSIGAIKGNRHYIYADEMLFYEDPRELYKHWPQEIWKAIERGEVQKGMNENQVTFAAGFGTPERGSDAEVRTVQYPRDGRLLRVTYRNGKVASIEAIAAGE
ncbi:MAG: hypothetical protein L0Z53_11050 [Acidobacteriales bacterium]|nr:hypothetical protein [Terriglobales bacterium]